MATRHSSRRRPAGPAGPSRPAAPAPKVPRPAESAAAWKRTARTVIRAADARKEAKPPDFDEILGHFSEALALVECAHSALDAVQEIEGVGLAIGAAVLTVERGLAELRRTYTELDLAIQRGR